MTQLAITWPHPESYVAAVVNRLVGSIPPPPESGTRLRQVIRLSMVRGPGDRRHDCAEYERCLGEAARKEGDWHCKARCTGYAPVSREERLFEAIAGRCSSPLAEAQIADDPMPEARPRDPGKRPLVELVLEALAGGSMTTPQIATATGYARSTLSTRMIDLERDGLVRRIGFEVVHAKTSARTVRWALKEAAK